MIENDDIDLEIEVEAFMHRIGYSAQEIEDALITEEGWQLWKARYKQTSGQDK